MFKPDPKLKPIDGANKTPASSYRQMGLKAFRKKGKYNNVSTEYGDKRYDSMLEAKVAQDLDWQIKSGDILKWERQVTIPLRVNGVLIANYRIDFIATNKHGQRIYIEVKGLELPLWKMKWRLLTALINEIDPGAELMIVKQ